MTQLHLGTGVAASAATTLATAAVLAALHAYMHRPAASSPKNHGLRRYRPGSKPQISSDGLITTVIPAYNEGPGIAVALAALAAAAVAPHLLQVIVVDGGCTDDTVAAAKAAATLLPFAEFIITQAAGGRGPALHAGAMAASGELLLFLHADTTLPYGFDVALRRAFADPSLLLSCFQFKISRIAPASSLWQSSPPLASTMAEASALAAQPLRKQPILSPPLLSLLELSVDRRVRTRSFPYGDQALCMSASTYTALGGFPGIPIMEDFEFIRQALALIAAAPTGCRGDSEQQQWWHIQQLPLSACCSARRWEKRGVVRTTALNFALVFRYVVLGQSAESIYRRYYV